MESVLPSRKQRFENRTHEKKINGREREKKREKSNNNNNYYNNNINNKSNKMKTRQSLMVRTDASTISIRPDRVAQSVGHLTRKSGVLGLIPGLATYFRFSFRFSKKGSCQLLATVCAPSTG